MTLKKEIGLSFLKKKEELESKIKEAETIGISGHQNPDGDCIGSCLALYTYIKDQYPKKKVDLYLEPIPEKFSFLKYVEVISQEKKQEEPYDLFFSLDCSEPERLHHFMDLFTRANNQVCVDHHFTNQGFGDLRFICPEASSTCEILFDIFSWENISFDCAQDLYMGIVHDTGVFKHTNTTRKVMETAGALLDKGLHSEEIIDQTFYRKTYKQNQVLGKALMKSELLLQGRVIFSILTRKDLASYEAESSDLDGIIDQLRITEGVECALLLYETEEGSYKVSMRAKDTVDVSSIAAVFGGGGHVKAAGCTVKGNPMEIVKEISQMVKEQIEESEKKNSEESEETNRASEKKEQSTI